jgi:hypothetical protein
MRSVTPPSPRLREQGQLFTGWVIGIFIIATLVVYAADTMRRSRNTTESVIYRELALNVAKAGFEDGLSFFRTHSNGCYLPASDAPTSQNWVTPWPDYPDSAFLPQAVDTDFYSNIAISTPNLGNCAGGIIGDVTMDQYVTYTGTDDMSGSTLWGRYVIRRQNIQNWSPGPDTMSANTDPDAAHDISAITTQSALGSGVRWSIVSRGYLLRLPSPVTTTSYTSSLLGTTAAFTDGNLLSAPLTYYNNQPFLLAQARVYGELARINFNLPESAVLLPQTSSLDVNTNGILDSGGLTGEYAYTVGTSNTIGSNAGSITGTLNPSPLTPSIANCFPGQTLPTMRAIATSLEGGGQIQGYVGGMEQLPVFNGTNGTNGESYLTQVNQDSFYYLDTSITLSASSGQVPVLSGVGLCVVVGSLDIPTGNNSNWAGVLYVTGQVTLDGPTSITGILISQTGISIGNASDLNKTTVTYDAGIITTVQGLLKDFTVDSSSIVANQF